MVEQALVHRATVSTAARRTKVLVMLSFLGLIGILPLTVYRRGMRLPSRTPCQIDEILWQKRSKTDPEPALRMRIAARYQFMAAGR
jgi:hypothetical protein